MGPCWPPSESSFACPGFSKRILAVQDAFFDPFFDQQIYVVCRTIHINSWQLHGNSTKMADWSQPTMELQSRIGSQIKSLDEVPWHIWGLCPSQDFRKVDGMFINPILGMFIHLSQLGLHQPLVLRCLFRCRNQKKNNTTPHQQNPTPETSQRTKHPPRTEKGCSGRDEPMNPKTHLGWHVGHHALRLLHHLGREHGAVTVAPQEACAGDPGDPGPSMCCLWKKMGESTRWFARLNQPLRHRCVSVIHMCICDSASTMYIYIHRERGHVRPCYS